MPNEKDDSPSGRHSLSTPKEMVRPRGRARESRVAVESEAQRPSTGTAASEAGSHTAQRPHRADGRTPASPACDTLVARLRARATGRRISRPVRPNRNRNIVQVSNTKEMFDMVLRLLDREDQLINARMTWYLTIQGFIIAGVALAFTGEFKSHVHLKIPGIIALSILGIAISVVVFMAVLRARKAKRKVCDKWEGFRGDEKEWFPDPRGEPKWLSLWTPGQTVPLIFVLFWVAVIVAAWA